MSNGTYAEFRNALRAFESGWDRARYDAGIIQDWQLDQWAGGPVSDFYAGYSSWADLTDAEWDAMSYMSTNSLGFVGYQFGEALLIDLGYYDDDVFYGNGAASNTWDGTWTGKNGVTSLSDFMTAEAQETAIQEAFGYNLKIIEDGLSQRGESLDDYLGTSRTYVDNGVSVTVVLTMTGIMAAAHLRGAWGTLALLQAGSVSTDENGTSILRYIDQFGGYDAPSTAEAIAFFDDRKTGDEGLGAPGDPSGGADTTGDVLDNPAITKDNADVVVTWASGHHDVITGFDPETDTIFIDWIDATALDIANVNGSAVFSIPSNSQSTTLQGVSLADLQARNIHVQDSTARAELAGLIGSDTPDGGGGGEPGGTSGGGPGETGGTDSGTTTDGTGEPGGADGGTSGSETGKSGLAAEDVNNPGITAANADVVITWSYGQAVTRTDFDPATDTIFIDWIGAADLEVTEAGGTTTFSVPSNQHSVTLSGVALADLVAANIHAQDATARAELARLLSAGSDAGTPAGGTDSTGTVGVDTDVVEVTWNWAAVITIDGFDPAGDVLDFNGLAASDLLVVETGAGLIFEVLNNGGHSVTLTGIQAEDLGFDNLTADSWNTVLSETSGLMQQLQSLGFDPA